MQIKLRPIHDAWLSSARCILFHGATSCGGQHLAACCVLCRNRIGSVVTNALPSTHARAGRNLCTQNISATPLVVVEIVERALVAPIAAAATTQHALLGEDAPQRDGGGGGGSTPTSVIGRRA